MEEIQIVRGSNGQDIVPRVPLCVQDLPVEVQVVCAHFVTALPRVGRDLLVPENSPQGRHVARCLVAVVPFRLSVKDAEEIIVCSRDYFTDKKKVKETLTKLTNYKKNL